jgi:transcriptional regulator with GAF, ATPase, and Fis domain
MTDDPGRREHDVIRAFVELSNELVDGYDMVELLARLTTNCAHLLDVASAGLLLSDGAGVLHLIAASSERTHHLELFQLQRDEGPCLDCYRDGEAVIVPDLAAEEHRWPQFSSAATQVGFASVHALPMRLRNHVLGTLGLFGDRVGRLEDDDLALAQALVHVATIAIVNEKSAADHATVNAQLQHALTSRILFEQAKGVIAQSGGLEMEQAFNVLRQYARDHRVKLSDVAAQVVNRELPGEVLVEHARAAAIVP